jgi:hypothetical protein
MECEMPSLSTDAKFDKLMANGMAAALDWDNESRESYLGGLAREDLVLERCVKRRFKPLPHNPFARKQLNVKRIQYQRVAGEKDVYGIYHDGKFLLKVRASQLSKRVIVQMLKEYGFDV